MLSRNSSCSSVNRLAIGSLPAATRLICPLATGIVSDADFTTPLSPQSASILKPLYLRHRAGTASGSTGRNLIVLSCWAPTMRRARAITPCLEQLEVRRIEEIDVPLVISRARGRRLRAPAQSASRGMVALISTPPAPAMVLATCPRVSTPFDMMRTFRRSASVEPVLAVAFCRPMWRRTYSQEQPLRYVGQSDD